MRALYLTLILAAAGCGPRTTYTQTNTPPNSLLARQPEQVEVLDKPPTRPFLQLGIFEAEQKSAYTKADSIIQRIRKDAGKLGCEAVLIESRSEDGAVGLKSFRAACLIYTAPVAPPVAPVPAEPSKACAPNETRMCYGPGACQGGQYCLPDGSGFSGCDCGGQEDGGVPPVTKN